MIRIREKDYLLNTLNTSYCFHVMPSGHLEQLYYGRKLFDDDVSDECLCASYAAMTEKKEFPAGNAISYSKKFINTCLEDVALEISMPGKGDIREHSMVIVNSEGIRTSDPVFVKHEIIQGTVQKPGLPGSHPDASDKSPAETLAVTLSDEYSDAEITLYYTVFHDKDVITRSVSVKNRGRNELHIEKLMSLCLDLYGKGFRYTDFSGHWTREMHKDSGILNSGAHVICSRTGTSSNRMNPLFIISEEAASEDYGCVYGFNLIYSGNHYESMSVGSFPKTRFMAGIEPESFDYYLEPGETFYSPEAVMTFSDRGFTGMSHNFHRFVTGNIIPERFRDVERPVLLNSWEANYFDFTEESLLELAESAREAGAELFVLDDGWFGKRDDDHSSLGDWRVYTRKLPGGLASLSDKIHSLGMKFGLWVEPEMINEDSELYREHPDYAVKIPGHTHSEGRFQMIIDLTRREVQDNIIEQLKAVFSSCRLEYVKWDMNRIFSDCYSTGLKASEQGGFGHRYVLGLYRVMRELTDAFPDILFEGCASGGNRFDLGILAYFPQIWGSDDTDALERFYTQEGYSYGYPLITVGSHVSDVPNHQTMRCEPLESRFAVACTGAFGYELALNKLPREEFLEICGQISFYKKYRSTLQKGTYYRLNDEQWMIVSEDRRTALGFCLRRYFIPNDTYQVFKTKGLEDSYIYHVTNRVCGRDASDFGSLMKSGGWLEGEKEDSLCRGSVLNSCGIRLMQSYCGTGYNERTRVMKDLEARIYIFEAETD
ncbi:MAG: alpha-galactosidase [Lachnospiraceae bacterium]|nr:alpha-galactosidase [Lachnospiraceae bacterium]